VGILAVVLKDASVASGVEEHRLQDIADIPDTLSVTNQEYLELAFMGIPKEIKAVVISDAAVDYNDALNYLETIKWNTGCIPGIDAADVSTVTTWAKSMRDNKERKIIMVLPDSDADHEAVVNFVVEDGEGTPGTVDVGEENYSVSEYSARVAGLIAGLPLTVAPTFQVLSEVDDVPHMTKSEADAMVDAGKFFLYHDGEKVKVARGVTSLVTTTETKGADWKKIKLVRILDMVYHDIKSTIEDVYIGKYQNSYENKLLLLSAINAYFEVLEQELVLDPGKNRCEINVPAQKTYLRSIGEDVDNMTEQEIKEANTRDQVFLVSTVRPLDAIEDVDLIINL
jgi:hypothetical protein